MRTPTSSSGSAADRNGAGHDSARGGTDRTAQPAADPAIFRHLPRRGPAMTMELVPRTTRAQMWMHCHLKHCRRLQGGTMLPTRCLSFPMLMTAAGTVRPARVLVSCRCCGLQAIAPRTIGAVVEAFDTRPVVKEQVQSLGATFVELELGSTTHRTLADTRASWLRSTSGRERADSQSCAKRGRRHYNRARTRPSRSASRDQGDCRVYEARLGDCRSCRGARW